MFIRPDSGCGEGYDKLLVVPDWGLPSGDRDDDLIAPLLEGVHSCSYVLTRGVVKGTTTQP